MLDFSLSQDLREVVTHPKALKGAKRKLFRQATELDPQAHPDDYVLEMDWSSLEGFLACDRKALHGLVYSRNTYPTAALTYGSGIHAALEYWYRNDRPTDEASIQTMIGHGEQFLLENPPGDDYRNLTYMDFALRRYIKEYQNEQFEVLKVHGQPAVEIAFALPLGEIEVQAQSAFAKSLLVHNNEGNDATFFIRKIHVVWTGLIDNIIGQQGKIWIQDHKTSSVGGETYWTAFQLSQQFRGYTWAAKKLFPGLDVDGAMANVIFGRKPTKTGTPLEFERRYYSYDEESLQEWQEDILILCEDLAHRLTTGAFPMHTNACQTKYGACPWLDVCTQPESKRGVVLFSNLYTDNVWNPLNQ